MKLGEIKIQGENKNVMLICNNVQHNLLRHKMDSTHFEDHLLISLFERLKNKVREKISILSEIKEERTKRIST